MDTSSNIQETPPQLDDALARLEQAKDDYVFLAEQLNEFLCNYVKGMVKEFNPETGAFDLQFRHPKESNVTGRPAVLVAQIGESPHHLGLYGLPTIRVEQARLERAGSTIHHH